jgi:hypothetical protein
MLQFLKCFLKKHHKYLIDMILHFFMTFSKTEKKLKINKQMNAQNGTKEKSFNSIIALQQKK